MTTTKFSKTKWLNIRWDSWQFKPSTLVLYRYYYGDGACSFEVDLEKINSWRDVYYWTRHVGGMQPHEWERHHVLDFMHAIEDILRHSGIRKEGCNVEKWSGLKVGQKYVTGLLRQSQPDLTPAQRWAVLDRDNYTCQCCGKSSPEVELHVDHIIPRDKGGLNDLGNLQTLCGSGWNCNVSKSNKIPSNAGEIIAPPPKLTGLITATEMDVYYRLTHY